MAPLNLLWRRPGCTRLLTLRAPVARATNGNGNGASKGQDLDYWDDFLAADRFEGERNCSMIKVVGKLYHSGLRDPILLSHVLTFYNDARFKPPFAEETAIKEIINAVCFVSNTRLRRGPGDGD